MDTNHYKPGDNYVIDDVTGLKIRASKSCRRWDNAIVAKDQCEPRHPQEFVRGVKDGKPPQISRPRQALTFLDTNEVTTEDL